MVTEPQEGIDASGDFGGGAELVVGEVSVPYVPGSAVVADPAGVAALRAALAPSAEGSARVVASEGREVAVVPASALVQGVDGTLCVYGAPEGEPVVVVPLGGGVGSIQLPADLPIDEVLANPGTVAPDLPCGS